MAPQARPEHEGTAVPQYIYNHGCHSSSPFNTYQSLDINNTWVHRVPVVKEQRSNAYTHVAPRNTLRIPVEKETNPLHVVRQGYVHTARLWGRARTLHACVTRYGIRYTIHFAVALF